MKFKQGLLWRAPSRSPPESSALDQGSSSAAAELPQPCQSLALQLHCRERGGGFLPPVAAGSPGPGRANAQQEQGQPKQQL